MSYQAAATMLEHQQLQRYIPEGTRIANGVISCGMAHGNISKCPRFQMNQGAEDFLKKLAQEQESKQAEQDAKPAVEAQFQQDYKQKELLMRGWVAKFNSGSLAEAAKVSLQLDGPTRLNDADAYILRLIGGKSYPDGKVFLLEFPWHYHFEDAVINIAVWQSNLNINSLRNFSGYPPNKWPKQSSEEAYKLVQSGSTYGWVFRKENPLSFEELFDYLVERLLKLNVVVGK